MSELKKGEIIYFFSDETAKISKGEVIKVESEYYGTFGFCTLNIINDFDETIETQVNKSQISRTLKGALEIMGKMMDEEIKSIEELKNTIKEDTIYAFKDEYNRELRLDKFENIIED